MTRTFDFYVGALSKISSARVLLDEANHYMRNLSDKAEDLAAEAEALRRQRDEALQALRDLIENYKHNNGKGLGIGPVTKAKAILAQYTEDAE